MATADAPKIMRLTTRDGRRVSAEITSDQVPQFLLRPSAGATRKGGRQTKPTAQAVISTLSSEIVPRDFRGSDLNEMLHIIRDLDPQVSQAVWNYLRLMNPGNDLVAINPKSRAKEASVGGTAQSYLDDLTKRVGAEYGGGLDQLLNVLNLSLITHGAQCMEVAPTPGLDDVEDWYPVDPSLIAFRRDANSRLTMGQIFRDGTFVELNEDLCFYQPLDPDIDNPYGRPPMVSALNAVLIKAQVLHDLKAVAHNQGFPRIDVSVDWQAIIDAAPPALKVEGQQAALAEWAHDQLAEIVGEYEDLEVDDTFIHYGFVDLKMVGGTAPASLGFDFAKFVDILERQLNQALKSLPILQGINESTTETHGSIQWQIQVAGIAALGRLTKRIVEKAADASLRLKGIAAASKMHYHEIRSVDRLFEAQSGLFEAKAAQIAVQQGWESNDAVANQLFGHDAVAEPLPQASQNADLNPNNSGDKTPGAADNGPGAGGDEVQTPAEVQSKTDPGWALLLQELREPPGDALFPGRLAARVVDASNDLAGKYGNQASLIFLGEQETLISELSKEGVELRDPPRDIADYVFGLRYSRAMKALLREAILEGMRLAGVANPVVDERIVRRIWADNLQYVRKLRDELKAALRSGEFKTLDDVRTWFAERAWREELMGRYLAKQGLTAGYSAGRAILAGADTRFLWQLTEGAEHCASCLERAGRTYTHDELLSVGFPGSGSLLCGANCKCVLVETESA